MWSPYDRSLSELPRFTTDAGFMSGWRYQFKDVFRYDEDGRITSYDPDWTNARLRVDMMATWLGVMCRDKVPPGFFDRIMALLPAGSSTKRNWSSWVELGSALVDNSAEPGETWNAMHHILQNLRSPSAERPLQTSSVRVASREVMKASRSSTHSGGALESPSSITSSGGGGGRSATAA